MNRLNFNDLQTSLTELLSVFSALEYHPDHFENNQMTIRELGLRAISETLIYSSQNLVGKWYGFLNATKRWIVSAPHFEVESTLEMVFKAFDEAITSSFEKRCLRIHWIVHRLKELFLKEKCVLPQGNTYNQLIPNFRQHLLEEIPALRDSEVNILLDKFAEYKKLTVKEVKGWRVHINEFISATYDFWDWFLLQHHYFQNQQKNFIYPLLPCIKMDALIFNISYFKALEAEASWVWLEGCLQMEIPVLALAKVKNPSQLKIAEQEILHEWIESLNQFHQTIPSKLFRLVLIDIIKIIQIEGSHSLSFMEIVSWLKSQNCMILNETDSFHLKWRSMLHEHKSVICNGIKLDLGEELKGYDPSFVCNYFEIEGRPNWILQVPNNLFALHHLISKESQPIPIRASKRIKNININQPHDVRSGLDHEGKCAVVEKLQVCRGFQWSSQSVFIDSKDKEILQVMCNHLYYMAKKGDYQYDISLEKLGRNPKGKFKYVDPNDRVLETFDYGLLEKRCLKMARGNIYILNYLIGVARFRQSPTAAFYRKMVLEVFETFRNDVITESIAAPFNTDKCLMHAHKLRKKAFAAVNECMKTVTLKLNIYLPGEKEALKKMVSQRLKGFYFDHLLSYPFPKDLVEQVSQSFQSKADLNKDLIFDPPIYMLHEEYYEREWKEIMMKNLHVAKQKELK